MFNWKEYLELAKFLQRQGSNAFIQEAMCRGAISKAYYGAFCHARNYARDYLGYIPKYDNFEHGAIRAYYQTKKMRYIATRLDTLRQWRNACDYQDSVPNLTSIMNDAIKEAEYIFNSLPNKT